MSYLVGRLGFLAYAAKPSQPSSAYTDRLDAIHLRITLAMLRNNCIATRLTKERFCAILAHRYRSNCTKSLLLCDVGSYSHPSPPSADAPSPPLPRLSVGGASKRLVHR